MALTTPRIVGYQAVVTLTDADGTISITKWQTITVTEEETTAAAKAADSQEDEEVWTGRRLTVALTGFLGAVNNGATLPAIGDAMTAAPSVKVGADEVLPVLSQYTNIKVVGLRVFTFGNDPATFTVNLRSGRLN